MSLAYCSVDFIGVHRHLNASVNSSYFTIIGEPWKTGTDLDFTLFCFYVFEVECHF